MTDLSGKTALVTGSTSGIGRGIATVLARAGAHVMLNGFGEKQVIEAVRAELDAAGAGRIGFSGADLTDPTAIEQLIADTHATLGPVDILVNNAGMQFTARVEDFPPSKWDQIIALNLSACFHTARLVVAGMRQRGWGRIINIASVHGLVASIEKAPYVAAKHGLVGMTKVIALENAGTGVTCNAICPGWVLTPLIESQIEDRAKAGGVSTEEAQQRLLGEKQPTGGFALPEEIGALALYLCSDAARQITGASLPIDGAWTAQ